MTLHFPRAIPDWNGDNIKNLLNENIQLASTMVPVDWLIHWSAFSKIKILRTSVTTPIRYCLHRIRSTFSIRLNIYHKTHVNETSVHIDLSSYAHTLSLVYRTFDILHNNITKSNEHQKYKVQISKYSAFRVKTVRFRPQVKTKYLPQMRQFALLSIVFSSIAFISCEWSNDDQLIFTHVVSICIIRLS